MQETAAILIVSEAIGRYEYRMDDGAAANHFRKQRLPVYQFPFVLFSDLELFAIEFHLAHVYDIVLAVDEQVDLGAVFFVVTLHCP